MLYALIGCLLIIGFLGFKLYKKQEIDQTALNKYKAEISQATKQWKETMQMTAAETERCKAAHEARQYEEEQVEKLKRNANEALQLYHDTIDVRMSEIETSMEEQRQKRQAELDNTLNEKQWYYERLLQDTIDRCALQDEAIKEASETKWRESIDKINEYNKAIADAKEKFEGIERALMAYAREKEEKLFYTIQLPEEYHEDIEFLLTTVASKVQHPDIISKLVWAEYVKPNLDETFKRIQIKAEPGIYKLTNIDSGKAYIGKSTNVKTRIADHFKSSVGIKSIADQAVHHAILKEGFWNWQIEIITYCEKDQLSELEKYYINFFDTQTYGYNRNAGG